jgi:hypothetical protein
MSVGVRAGAHNPNQTEQQSPGKSRPRGGLRQASLHGQALQELADDGFAIACEDGRKRPRDADSC